MLKWQSRTPNAILLALCQLGAISCGGTADSDANSQLADNRSASADEQARCASLLNQPGDVYPVPRERRTDELDELERQSALFRVHYGDVSALYSIQPKHGSSSPDISLLRPDDSVVGIQLDQGPLSLDGMISGTDEFVSRWNELLNPYAVEIAGQSPTQDRDLYVQRDFLQTYCGLEIRFGDQHEYTGRLHFTAYRGSATILFAYSSLVPMVPLPSAELAPAEVEAALVDQQLVPACGIPEVVTSSACFLSDPRQVVFVAPDGAGISFRLAYEVDLRGPCVRRRRRYLDCCGRCNRRHASPGEL